MSGMIAFPSKIARTLSVPIVGLIVLLSSASARAQEGDVVPGLFITVQNPITDAAIKTMRKKIERAQAKRGIKKVIFDFNPDDSEAATPEYGSCHDLAAYILELKNNGVYTVAFVHGNTRRHTVLPALACNDLIMSRNAKIGEVTEPNKIPQLDEMEFYARVVGEEKEAVVLKMLDKNVEVVLGRKGGTPIYVDVAKAMQKDVNVAPASKANPVLPRGTLGFYSLEQAMKFRLCSDSLENRPAVKEKYRLDPASMEDDERPHKIKATRIDLTGPIDGNMQQKLKGQFKEVRSKKENTIFFVLECNGGSAKVAREIAEEIRDLKNDENDPIWTTVFIPNKASDLSVFIAFACNEIVMYKGSDPTREASIGDFEPFLTAGKSNDPSNTVEGLKRNLGEIAEMRGYSKVIVEGMLDKDLTIHLVRDRNKAVGTHEPMTGKEYDAALKKKDNQLQLIKTIKQPGSYLTLNATMAKELLIAQTTVDNRDVKEVYALYGLTEKDVRDSKPGWMSDFAAFLRRTEVSILLVIIGFAGLILEFKMPGATIPGLVALACFVLFFWAQAYANGNTIVLAVALFVLGLILLGVEIFILPGFGVTGISGVLLLLAGIGLATMEKAPLRADSCCRRSGLFDAGPLSSQDSVRESLDADAAVR